MNEIKLEKSIKIAENQIKKTRDNTYKISNWMIRQNIKLVKKEPQKFYNQFVKMYN